MRIPRPVSWPLAVAVAFFTAAAPSAYSARPSPTPRPTPTTKPVSRSLADLAKRIRLRRPAGVGKTGSPSIIIDNENLSQFSNAGSITMVNRPGAKQAGSPTPATGVEPGRSSKEYWRGRYKQQLGLVQSLKKRLKDLSSEIPDLWNRFYAQDDPAYRDGVIKPKLDRDLQEDQALKKRLKKEEAKLPQILEDARRAGAPSSWFRDLE